MEGYLSSSEDALAAAVAAREFAESAGVKTAISLSDPSMVTYFRANLARILGNGVDHLFCNEEEALSWAGTDRLDLAANELRDIGRTVCITLGKQGCVVVQGRESTPVPGFTARPVDTNGAGDIFAGACLFGWCTGMDTKAAATFGNFAAAALIQAYGARFRQLDEYRQVLGRFTADAQTAARQD